MNASTGKKEHQSFVFCAFFDGMFLIIGKIKTNKNFNSTDNYCFGSISLQCFGKLITFLLSFWTFK